MHIMNTIKCNTFCNILRVCHSRRFHKPLLRCDFTSSNLNVRTYSQLSISGCMNNAISLSPVVKQYTTETRTPLTKRGARDLVVSLSSEERTDLLNVLQEFESEQTKAHYKGQLAAFRWRSKFGRPSKVQSTLGDVDPTGSYCPVPEDWLLKKYAETVPKPTSSQLFAVGVHNACPFVGFGFLDNFFMIICGDYIELYLGSIITLSTMAAAALGNTFSDVLGIGSAFYVELAVSKFGFKPPNLSPIQLDMTCTRIAANMGRVIGVTIGCLLGMLPLMFLRKDDKNGKAEMSDSEEPQKSTTVEKMPL